MLTRSSAECVLIGFKISKFRTEVVVQFSIQPCEREQESCVARIYVRLRDILKKNSLTTEA